MIVRCENGGWTLVRQMDHAAHCGSLARAGAQGPAGPDSVGPALQYAAGYHDLGWVDSDAAPELQQLAAGIEREMAHLAALSQDSVLLFSKDRRKPAARALPNGVPPTHPSARARH